PATVPSTWNATAASARSMCSPENNCARTSSGNWLDRVLHSHSTFYILNSTFYISSGRAPSQSLRVGLSAASPHSAKPKVRFAPLSFGEGPGVRPRLRAFRSYPFYVCPSEDYGTLRWSDPRGSIDVHT